MFEIREEQFSTFQIESRRQFALRVADFLRENMEEAKGQERFALAIEIEPLLHRGQSYGLTTEQELAVYVISASYLGKDFDEKLPQAVQILNHPEWAPEQKALKLEKFTVLVVDQLQVQGSVR